MQSLSFNPKPSAIMHIDFNSCFATIEQQANPFLRGKPIVVAAYDTPNGCILAPSIEAKRFGIKTGMRVKDAKLLYSKLIILKPDPWKYRNVHIALRKLLLTYTNDVQPKSIDEFVLNLDGYLHLPLKARPCKVVAQSLSPIWKLALEIKKRIKEEIGDFLTVSIGIAPNRFLAKLASNLQKPDGLVEINKDNFLIHFDTLKLTDLPYIKSGNSLRLNGFGIYTVMDFYNAPLWKLRVAFKSINSYYWYMRIHGFEVDDVLYGRRSYGNSYSLPKSLTSPQELSPILTKLVTKMSDRIRHAGYKASGVHLAVSYCDGSFYHKGVGFPEALFDTRDIYKKAFGILITFPKKPVRNIAVSCFNLIKSKYLQLNIFENVNKKTDLNFSIDKVNKRWGNFIIVPSRMADTSGFVPDRIAFGSPRFDEVEAGGIKEFLDLFSN